MVYLGYYSSLFVDFACSEEVKQEAKALCIPAHSSHLSTPPSINIPTDWNVKCLNLYSCSVPATECRNFLLYYLVPSLQGILPNEYLAHALLLSKSIRILLGDQITSGDMELVCELLDLFWKLFEHYYGWFPQIFIAKQTLLDLSSHDNIITKSWLPLSGVKHCTVNVHLLSHLPYYVYLYGPLWTHSAFSFEDGIGYLVRRCHATHDIAHQV